MKNVSYPLALAVLLFFNELYAMAPRNVHIIPGQHLDDSQIAKAKDRGEAIEAIQSIHDISELSAALVYIKRLADNSDQKISTSEMIKNLREVVQGDVKPEHIALITEKHALNDPLEGEIVAFVQLAEKSSNDQPILEIVQKYMPNL
jgi:hypothetical protein